MPQLKHKNNQKASTDFAELCWMLYVPMIVTTSAASSYSAVEFTTLCCALKPASIYGLQEKCKNMLMRFQSPLV